MQTGAFPYHHGDRRFRAHVTSARNAFGLDAKDGQRLEVYLQSACLPDYTHHQLLVDVATSASVRDTFVLRVQASSAQHRDHRT